MNRAQAEKMDQYTLWQILGIWALVTLPMALLVWVIAPALIPHSPFLPGITYWLLIIAGMAWESVVALVSFIFNYFLAEEFLWHGILLPKMQGVFGKYDWVANAVLFGFYHVMKPWNLPSVIVSNMTYSWPARRFRSNWMAIIVHGAELLPTLVMVLAVILGILPR
jgi:hypothetical protein